MPLLCMTKQHAVTVFFVSFFSNTNNFADWQYHQLCYCQCLAACIVELTPWQKAAFSCKEIQNSAFAYSLTGNGVRPKAHRHSTKLFFWQHNDRRLCLWSWGSHRTSSRMRKSYYMVHELSNLVLWLLLAKAICALTDSIPAQRFRIRDCALLLFSEPLAQKLTVFC